MQHIGHQWYGDLQYYRCHLQIWCYWYKVHWMLSYTNSATMASHIHKRKFWKKSLLPLGNQIESTLMALRTANLVLYGVREQLNIYKSITTYYLFCSGCPRRDFAQFSGGRRGKIRFRIFTHTWFSFLFPQGGGFPRRFFTFPFLPNTTTMSC